MGRPGRKKRSPTSRSPEDAATRIRLPRQITREEFVDASEEAEESEQTGVRRFSSQSDVRDVPPSPTDSEPTVIRRFSSQSDIPDLDDAPVEDDPTDIRRFFGKADPEDPPDDQEGEDGAEAAAGEDEAEDPLSMELIESDSGSHELLLDMPDDSDDYQDREVWERHTSLSDATAPTLFERVNQAQSVLAILRACLPADKALEELEAELLEAAGRIATLNTLTPGSDEHREQSATIAGDLRRIERSLLERERKVPLSWLRHQADEYDFSESSFAHYLRFQIKYLRESPESWSRIDLVLTRLARKRNEDGTYSVRSAEEVAELWSACLPPSETEVAVRKAAIEFFQLSLRRLDELQDIEDLFSTGYYIDVLGYKLSLRRDYFDPPVLYAAATLNVAITNWLEAHHGRHTRALDKQFAEAHAQVRKILHERKRESSALIRMWSRLFAPKEAEKPAPAPRPTEWERRKKAGSSKLLRQLLVPAAVLILLVLGVPMFLGYAKERQRDLRALPAWQVQELHGLLATASYSGDPPRLMVGTLDAQRWLELDSSARAREVESLLGALRERGVDNAMVYRGQVLAIHIVGGQVRFAE